MLQITDISPQKKKENRVSIFLNDDFWLGMDKSTQEKLGLKIGLVITEANKGYIEQEAIYEEAFSKALNFLNWRMRTIKEVQKKLKDYEEDIVKRVIEKLEEYKYVNDLDFAYELLHSTRISNKGPKWFKNKAFEYGVPSEYVDQVLEESEYGTNDQVQEIKEFLSTSKATSFDKQKLMRKLFSRGYDYDAIKEAIEDLSFDS